jgi:hypothetical protein
MADKKTQPIKAVAVPGEGIFKGARQSPSTPSAFIEIPAPKAKTPPKK